MNHDACHCLDYKNKCPKDCYRAKLTREYFEMKRAGKIDFPTSWGHFRKTPICERKNRRVGE